MRFVGNELGMIEKYLSNLSDSHSLYSFSHLLSTQKENYNTWVRRAHRNIKDFEQFSNYMLGCRQRKQKHYPNLYQVPIMYNYSTGKIFSD